MKEKDAAIVPQGSRTAATTCLHLSAGHEAAAEFGDQSAAQRRPQHAAAAAEAVTPVMPPLGERLGSEKGEPPEALEVSGCPAH